MGHYHLLTFPHQRNRIILKRVRQHKLVCVDVLSLDDDPIEVKNIVPLTMFN